MRKYVISGATTIVHHSHQTLNTVIPSVVCQQKLEAAHIQNYINMHMIHETIPTNEHDNTENVDTQFRNCCYNTYFVHPQYGLDTYWDED